MRSVIEKFVQKLGDEYSVINSYDQDSEQSISGIIAVNVTNIQSLNHGNTKDRKLTVTVSGQFLIQDDLNGNEIKKMYEYCDNILNTKILVDEIENCGAVFFESTEFFNTEETNNFTINYSVFIIED